jgi:hypothetical protein
MTVVFALCLIILGMAIIYRNFTISNYNFIILLAILAFGTVTILLVASIPIIFSAYKTKKIKPSMAVFAKKSLNILFPLISLLLKLLRNNKDAIRKFYININNILMESSGAKFRPQEVLLVLPHCLQNFKCGIKITADIRNCKDCGLCTVGDIKRMAQDMGIKALIVTGGTAARNIISQEKPKIVIAVACERDLISGIFDVKNLCVIGVTNERPNGPCKDTFVDVETLRNKILSVII